MIASISKSTTLGLELRENSHSPRDDAIPAPNIRGPLFVLIRPNSMVKQKKRSNL